MTLFESLTYDLLVEGKSPEEIKQLLKGRFADIPEEIISDIVNMDPTKKKSYSMWALTKYASEGNLLTAALKDGRLKQLFEYIREHNDVQLQTISTLAEALKLLPETDTIFQKTGGPEDNYKIVFDNPEWRICVPYTYEADKKLGENCRWCTAGAFGEANGPSYFKNYYGPEGELFVNFDKRAPQRLNGKEYPYTRYQFCFKSPQFMDAFDDRINKDDIDIPEDVLQFYQDEGYDTDLLSEDEEETWERYDEWRFDQGWYVIDGWEFLPDNAGPHIPNHDEDLTYYLYYIEDDSYDPVSWIEYEINDYEERDEDNEVVVLKEKANNEIFACINGSAFEDKVEFYEIFDNPVDEGKIIFTQATHRQCTVLVKDAEVFINSENNGAKIPRVTETEYNKDISEARGTLCIELWCENRKHYLIELYMGKGNRYGHRIAQGHYLIENETPLNGEYFTTEDIGQNSVNYGDNNAISFKNGFKLVETENGYFIVNKENRPLFRKGFRHAGVKQAPGTGEEYVILYDDSYSKYLFNSYGKLMVSGYGDFEFNDNLIICREENDRRGTDFFDVYSIKDPRRHFNVIISQYRLGDKIMLVQGRWHSNIVICDGDLNVIRKYSPGTVEFVDGLVERYALVQEGYYPGRKYLTDLFNNERVFEEPVVSHRKYGGNIIFKFSDQTTASVNPTTGAVVRQEKKKNAVRAQAQALREFYERMIKNDGKSTFLDE